MKHDTLGPRGSVVNEEDGGGGERGVGRSSECHPPPAGPSQQALQGGTRKNHPHFTDVETETQNGPAACPRSPLGFSVFCATVLKCSARTRPVRAPQVKQFLLRGFSDRVAPRGRQPSVPSPEHLLILLELALEPPPVPQSPDRGGG